MIERYERKFKAYRLLLVSSLLLGYVYCGTGTSRGPAVQGQVAPVFSFKDHSGKEFSLKDLRGRVVLVNFWATWCAPCVEEMPSMQSLQQHFRMEDLVVLALSVDDSWEPVDRFMRGNGFTLSVYGDFDRKISTLYGTSKFPETYILDKRGIVAYKVIGPTDWSAPEMVAFLRKLGSESG